METVNEKLELVPITLKQAKEFVGAHHRHNKPPVGWKFGVGVKQNGVLVGVVTAGRPVARMLDDGYTLEVNRTCTDGTRNANSKLYGAIWAAAKALGYKKCITYTQHDESGASLKAVGWTREKELQPRKSWAESTKDENLKASRDPIGTGGVARIRWSIEIK